MQEDSGEDIENNSLEILEKFWKSQKRRET